MLSTALVMPEDTEELALTLNGKKRKIKKADFVTSMQASGLEEKVINNILAKFTKVKERWFEFIDQSFLPDEMKEAFKTIIAEKLSLLAWQAKPIIGKVGSELNLYIKKAATFHK